MTAPVTASATGSPTIDKPFYGIGFGGAVGRYFKKYATFSGRASRSEFWWAFLFVGVVGAVIGALSALNGAVGAVGVVAGWIWGLLTLIPNLSIAIRRLHDTNKSGWWVLVPYLLVNVAQFIGLFKLNGYADTGADPAGTTVWVLVFGVALVIGAVLSIALYVAKSDPKGERFDK